MTKEHGHYQQLDYLYSDSGPCFCQHCHGCSYKLVPGKVFRYYYGAYAYIICSSCYLISVVFKLNYFLRVFEAGVDHQDETIQ